MPDCAVANSRRFDTFFPLALSFLLSFLASPLPVFLPAHLAIDLHFLFTYLTSPNRSLILLGSKNLRFGWNRSREIFIFLKFIRIIPFRSK